MAAGPFDDSTDLVRRIARGDREAFGRFYDRHAPLVFTFALRLMRSRPDAEDLLQDVFLQVWRQAGGYSEARGHPEAWLLTITRSRGIDKLRSIRRRGEQLVPSEESAGTARRAVAESGAAHSEAKLAATDALAGLPAAQRTVLELAYFDGLTQTEIAARLGEPLGTVKTRMRSGLERLRNLLGPRGAGAIGGHP
jgi:RNA polymerase sigma-70 factor (ECF subfamily)